MQTSSNTSDIELARIEEGNDIRRWWIAGYVAVTLCILSMASCQMYQDKKFVEGRCKQVSLQGVTGSAWDCSNPLFR